MLLSHRIRLNPTPAQCIYFACAAGTARKVWNWALAEWNRLAAEGQHPNAMALKKHFNAIKYVHPDWLGEDGQPWLRTIHRDAHAQPFAHLASAWTRYFRDRRAGLSAHPPRFKKKNRCRDSFYVANDRLRLDSTVAVLPKVGRVALTEALRWSGRIMGATVSRTADHWYLAVQVEVSDAVAHLYRTGNGVVGIDLGVTAAATLSSGEKIPAPRPLKAALRRLRIRARRQSRKLQAAKVAVIADPLPKGAKVAQSANHAKGARALARLHARIANVRHDFLHQLTTRLCRENQAVAIENLHVKGMLANRHLARSIADVGFFEFRRQMEYKAKRSGTMLLVADRWYPSSKLCSYCGRKHTGLMLSERSWTCSECGTSHDRDINAAVNLKRLATGALAARCALPVASPAATPDAAADLRSEGDGKVTLARHENGQPDGSGQEEKGHMDADLFDSSKMAW